MSITPIPHEQGRFFVQSESRPHITHLVDLQWQEDYHAPRPFCGCENCMAQHVAYCKHIVAVVEYERMRLHL